MTTRIAIAAGALLLAAVALWHPAPRPAFEATAVAPVRTATGGNLPRRHGRAGQTPSHAIDPMVYVAGAVRRPGLYHVGADDRAADAIARAGGLSATAAAGGVNLAAHTTDGDEIYVPFVGEASPQTRFGTRPRARSHRSGSPRTAAAIPVASVDVNAADAATLSRIPGIGRSIAARIVEVRERDGTFASLDELLDVNGMTQTRLDRARPFLQPP